jgi:hypothetical protein
VVNEALPASLEAYTNGMSEKVCGSTSSNNGGADSLVTQTEKTLAELQ